MEIKDIENLANLSRIELSEDEKNELLDEMDSVLGFVDQIQDVKIEDLKTEAGELRNIMREDNNPYVGGEFTDEILAEAPDTQDGFVKVKKIL
ncbi:MAG: Asp-tRNA(Asn)/Glu-tRNA(Gln) amidotransferase subunit GatC [Candidatus Pacebacteria bacterium]|nr:Asp-tRNA(Asn)/Glu-tRNA(Gln) amidotransferase subunit GatC [Candidatus Paceibacterota bacterium]